MKWQWNSFLGKSVRISAKNLKFKVVSFNKKYDKSDWRLANVDDVLDCYDDVKETLRDLHWYLCTLEDGYVGGPGYNYEVRADYKEKEHKLLVKVGR